MAFLRAKPDGDTASGRLDEPWNLEVAGSRCDLACRPQAAAPESASLDFGSIYYDYILVSEVML